MPLNDFSDDYPSLTSRLMQARMQNRIAHAYLFVGETGSRMDAFVHAFMQVCVCGSLTESGDACGTCRNCQAIVHDSYPYLNEVRPQSRSRQILVDEIREMEHFLHLTSGGETRLAVVHDADRMNERTQNAFLKTLEEPAADTIIILVTSLPSRLLPTIRSRCQVVAFFDNRVNYDLDEDSEMFRVLASMEVGAGSLVASRAAGMIQEHLTTIKSTFKADGEIMLKELKASAGDLEKGYVKRREEEIKGIQESLYLAERDRFLSALHTWFAQELMRACGIPRETLPNPEFYESVPEKLRKESSPVAARRQLDLVEKLLHTLRFNVDEELAVEDFCHALCAKSS